MNTDRSLIAQISTQHIGARICDPQQDQNIPFASAGPRASRRNPVAASRRLAVCGIVKADRWALMILIFIASLCVIASAAQGQPTPHIGYVYPAGGQRGTAFEITVGGQNLDGATNVYVSGKGITAKILEINKPMSMTQFNSLRDSFRELREKRQAALRHSSSTRTTNTWTAADEKTLEEIRNKILKNPPNRNATPAIAETITMQVAVDNDAQIGDRDIRIETANGFSNPLRFYVGELREFRKPTAKAPNPDLDRFLDKVGKSAPNNDSRFEMRVSVPSVINGQIMPGGVDRFRFSARKGQNLVTVVRARDLIPYLPDAVPGWFQPTLALYDGRGRELQFADDYRFNPDPVLFFQIPETTDYILEIRDAIYRGREDFVYRIAVSDAPFVTSLFPLGGKVGSETKVQLDGWNLHDHEITVRAATAGIQTVSFGSKDAGNSILFAADTLTESNEAEINNTAASAQQIKQPLVINGRIDQPGDVDVFRFEGSVGEEIVADVQARRLNSPLDSILKITDPSGKQIALNDDHEDKGAGLSTHHADSYIRMTLPQTGAYYLQIADAQHQGGSEFVYRLRISAPRPDFELRVVPSSVNIRAGASSPLTIYALRRDGFTNEIQLALKNAPTGFALSGARIPANEDKVRITLAASANATSPTPLEIEGRAIVNEHFTSRTAIPAEDMMQAFAYHHLVPAKELLATVSQRNTNKKAVTTIQAPLARIPVDGTTTVHINALKHTLSNKLHLALSDPPEGITLEKVSSSEHGMELVLRGDALVKPGLKGNLIIQVVSRDGKSKGNQSDVPLASLPAVPFEVVKQ